MASEYVLNEDHNHFLKTDKIFIISILKHLFSDTFQVKFQDGEEIQFGNGESKFKILFREPVLKADIINNPSIALGEAYMENKIDIEGDIRKVMESFYRNESSFLRNIMKHKKPPKPVKNTLKRNKSNISFHYDIGNEFYKLWLDSTMTYSCGYFRVQENSLSEAQENKINHILKKLSLMEGQTLLDIGCGWGQLIIAAAKQYKVKALGVTLSMEQMKEVTKRIREEHLEDLVEVELYDYRQIKNRKFDRIVSVGMIEHVGREGIGEYFSTINRLLNKGGISLVHSITGIRDGATNPWLDKYIFPGGYVPATRELVEHISLEGFHLLDAESLRRHYAKTLECWIQNYEDAIEEIKKTKDETFIRMWRLYLNACAASFSTGHIDIHQIMFSKGIADEISWTRDYMYQ